MQALLEEPSTIKTFADLLHEITIVGNSEWARSLFGTKQKTIEVFSVFSSNCTKPGLAADVLQMFQFVSDLPQNIV